MLAQLSPPWPCALTRRLWLQERRHIPGWVVQEQIQRPLLLRGRKFHLRAYALALQQPLAEQEGGEGLGAPTVFLYNRYDVRLAGAAHSDDYSDRAAHITNGNKDPAAVRLVVGPEGEEGAGGCPELGASGVLPKLHSWLARLFTPGLALPPPEPERTGSDEDAEDDAGDADGRAERDRTPAAPAVGVWSQFALLGADVMVDEEGRPWLLELNHNPALPELNLAPEPKPELEPEPEPERRAAETGPSERVGGPFARHIATMVALAIPLLLDAAEHPSLLAPLRSDDRSPTERWVPTEEQS